MIAYKQADAAALIGMGEDWMEDAPIPRCDIRKPGSSRPVWRWYHDDLVKFVESRRVLPGHDSPFGQ